MSDESEKRNRSIEEIEEHLAKLYSLSIKQTSVMISLVAAFQKTENKSDELKNNINEAFTSIDEIIKIYDSVSNDGKTITVNLGESHE